MTSETQNDATVKDLDKFWDRIDDVRAGMLGTDGGPRFIPMSHYTDRKANCLWFIAANGTDIVSAAQAGPIRSRYLASSADEGLYANIEGSLSVENDLRKLDELWNAVASAWFQDDERDPDVQLLKMGLTQAEVWSTTTKSLSFLYQIAKANFTDEKPDVGRHFRIAF
jgi:general stress protein 26